MKKHIKIKFVDFTPNFDPQKATIWKRLWDWYDVELSDHPDWLVYSVFGEEHLAYNDCVKIYWTGENQAPDFNFCDYAIGIDQLSFGDRYLYFPLWLCYTKDVDRMLIKHSDIDLSTKPDFCSFVYSNSNSSPHREEFFNALSNYKEVHSGGKFHNNIGGFVADKWVFEHSHKFSIAFENASHDGYTTEKLIQSFAAQTVPIYWGDPRVAETFNPDSFINCYDFPNWDAVVQRVKEIDHDDALWLKMVQTPALRNPKMVDEAMQQLDTFLRHIFDQEPSAAKRYSRDYWTLKQLRIRQREKRAYDRSIFGLAHRFFMKYFYPFARKRQWAWSITQKLMQILHM